MPEPIQRDVKASGVRLRVSDRGEGSPIVLLHSLFFVRSSWDSVSKELGSEFRLIAPDLPGFGESEKPSSSRFDYSLPAFANAIADLYAGLSLGPSCVVGHGLGGAVAVTLAAQHPELVSRLVLVDAHCYPAPFDLLSWVCGLPFLGSLALKQLWGRAAFRRYFRERIFAQGAEYPGERVDRYYDAFNPPSARASTLSTLRAIRDTRAVVADTARITAPTLVVWGRHDALYPAALAQRLVRDVRGAGFELMSSGHAPHEELPSAFAHLVARFCRSKRAGRSSA